MRELVSNMKIVFWNSGPKTIFSKRFLYFSRLLFAFTKIFVFNDSQIPKVKNNLLEEMNPEWNCIVSKKHALSKHFHGNRKEE